MFIAILQVALLPLAGAGLYRLWKHIASADRQMDVFVTVGLLARTAFGLVLYLASVLPIRFPPGVEDNNGFWFYAWDGRAYFLNAAGLALSGPAAILAYPTQAASVFYVKILAFFIYLFGCVATTGLLMNLLAYVGTCALLIYLFPRATRTTRIAVAALSLSPSLILWTLQPLKDVVFLFLVTAFVSLAARWQRQEGSTLLQTAATGVGMIAVLYAIAGIRWYFAFLLVVASILFFALQSLRTRRWQTALASALVLAGLVIGFYKGGGAYVPEALWKIVRPHDAVAAIEELPSSLATNVVNARKGFKGTAANTDIIAGREAPVKVAVAETLPKSATPPPSRPVTDPPPSAVKTTSAGSTLPRTVSNTDVALVHDSKDTGSSVLPAKKTATGDLSGALAPARVQTATPAPAQSAPPTGSTRDAVVAAAGDQHSATKSEVALPPARSPQAPDPAATPLPVTTAQARETHPSGATPSPAQPSAASVPAPVPATNPVAPPIVDAPPVATAEAAAKLSRDSEPKRTSPMETPAKRAVRHVKKPRRTAPVPQPVEAKPVRLVSAAPAAVPQSPSAPPVVVSRKPSAEDESGGFVQFRGAAKSSYVSQVMVGIAAMVLPRFVGDSLGVFHVPGGGAMWLFAEIDTLYFDAILLFAAISLLGALRRGGWSSPALLLVVMTTVVIAGMLAFTITNFGTLFRHREMVFIGLLMIPLLIARERASKTAAVDEGIAVAPAPITAGALPGKEVTDGR